MTNFETVIRKHQVRIPIIQRDYAQGRDDTKSTEVRTLFLDAISETLSTKKALHLDFVYGSIKNGKFIPLDGQQRLTTLFLLYWYFGKKENRDIDFLENFTYETRASSREFCSNLLCAEIDFTNDKISSSIRDSNWFLAFWENDPTIRAMLTMIDAIHNKFQEDNYYENLELITFHFFELEEFGLDDDLYIKMNARGKSLTDFENFKAKFEQHLEETNDELKQEFARKIDNEWTDFFWKYCVKDGSYLVDDFLLRYIHYIAEMLHNRESSEPLESELDFKQIKQIFRSEENIEFLFKSFDKLELVSKSFDEIFSKNEYEDGKVCLFDEATNLLEKIVEGRTINIQQRILLFLIIEHLTQYDINSELKDLIRVARNLTYRVKHLKRGNITYTVDLSFEDINPLLGIFLNWTNQSVYDNPSLLKNADLAGSPITKASLKHEIDKAEIIQANKNIKSEIFRLEDYKYLKGDIRNFLLPDESKLKLYNKTIREIYSQKANKVIRAMLTIDDYTMYIGWTWLGNKYFFGKENYWEVILTAFGSEEFSYSDFYKSFIETYDSNDCDLQKMVKEYLTNNDEKDWRYYFIKYSSMTETNNDLSRDNNIYAWHDDFRIEKMGGSNLNAYHISPLIKTISTEIDGGTAYIVQGVEDSYLQYEDLQIFSFENGWRIHNLNGKTDSDLIKKFTLTEEDGYHLLKETAGKDRIEILIDLIKEIKEQTANSK
ncbi:MAG: DUF262 domain-containing protein [Bacteroidales bacterium]|nr:DUF262 domain-containing protein [Bacteroidales bacterium]